MRVRIPSNLPAWPLRYVALSSIIMNRYVENQGITNRTVKTAVQHNKVDQKIDSQVQ